MSKTNVCQVSPHRFSIQWDSSFYADNIRFFIQSVVQSNILSRIKIHTLPPAEHGFSFDAQHVASFTDYMQNVKQMHGVALLDYMQATGVIASFVPFLLCLEDHGFTFSSLETDNILVIDRSVFLYTGIEHMIPIGLDKTRVSVPRDIQIHTFSAPEIRALDASSSLVIPCQAFYYSLAALLLHYMVPLEGFRETSLYWFIQRNISLDPRDRSLCFI